ncbi:m7GpppX diphosphatase [Episyrphus balteatus]|uniref:m7GpppX diphosphatase n=1 Tax=Episyrphus balteatus TaxID=286459 RepID=UPI002485E5C9|nr:m7GpppX diphosphatase [Episyrphus balteatus]
MADENGSNQKPNYDISKLKLTKILNNNTVRKSIALLGTFPDISESDQALVIFEKNAFTESDVQTDANAEKSFFSPKTKTNVEFINNIYGSFQCIPEGDLNCIKTTVVYPATDKHIEKYSIHVKYLINETPALYENITLTYLKSSQFSLDWVYNILDHKQETERIVFEDPDPETGFVLLPDLKWDGRSIESLYLLAIVHKHDIKSLRDLNSTHLPLLKNIRDSGTRAIEDKYGIPASQMRMYFHYQPSFYHLHVHFNPVGNDAPGIWCEKSHILETVINNLELVGDYYQRVTIPFVAYEGNKLLDIYDEELSVRKKIKLDKIDTAPTSEDDKNIVTE